MGEGIYQEGKEVRKFLNHTIQFFAKNRIRIWKKQVFVFEKGKGVTCFAADVYASVNANLIV